MMPNPYQLVDGRHGRFLANPNDFYIGGGLIEYGEYAEAEWQVLNQLLLPGKDVIEVGANAPELMAWYRDEFYAKLFYAGRVDVRTKELLRYRLSMTHGCAFCNKRFCVKSLITCYRTMRRMDFDAAIPARRLSPAISAKA